MKHPLLPRDCAVCASKNVEYIKDDVKMSLEGEVVHIVCRDCKEVCTFFLLKNYPWEASHGRS